MPRRTTCSRSIASRVLFIRLGTRCYGDPSEPSTSVVFGEKGSGKTAMCLQIASHLQNYNDEHPSERLFVIQYDDFNPFLDRFRSHFRRRRRADRVLADWRLWDHMDAILSLAVTGLVDQILEVRQPSHGVVASVNQSDVDNLDRNQARDLLVLAACYDQSTAETYQGALAPIEAKAAILFAQVVLAPDVRMRLDRRRSNDLRRPDAQWPARWAVLVMAHHSCGWLDSLDLAFHEDVSPGPRNRTANACWKSGDQSTASDPDAHLNTRTDRTTDAQQRPHRRSL